MAAVLSERGWKQKETIADYQTVNEKRKVAAESKKREA